MDDPLMDEMEALFSEDNATASVYDDPALESRLDDAWQVTSAFIADPEAFDEAQGPNSTPEVPQADDHPSLDNAVAAEHTKAQDHGNIAEGTLTSGHFDEYHDQSRAQLVLIVGQLKDMQKLAKWYGETITRMKQELSRAPWAQRLMPEYDAVDEGTGTGLPEYAVPNNLPMLPEMYPDTSTSNWTPLPAAQSQGLQSRINALREPWVLLRDRVYELLEEFQWLKQRVRQVRAYRVYISRNLGQLVFLPSLASSCSPPSVDTQPLTRVNQAPSSRHESTVVPPVSREECIDLTNEDDDDDDDDDDVLIIDQPPKTTTTATNTPTTTTKPARPVPAWKKRMATKTMSWYNQTSASPTQIKELGGPLYKTLNREARKERPHWTGRLGYDQIKTSFDPNGCGSGLRRGRVASKKRTREEHDGEEEEQHVETARVRKRAKSGKSPLSQELVGDVEPVEQVGHSSGHSSGEAPSSTNHGDGNNDNDDKDYNEDDEDAAEMAALLEADDSVAVPSWHSLSPETVNPREIETASGLSLPLSPVSDPVPVGPTVAAENPPQQEQEEQKQPDLDWEEYVLWSPEPARETETETGTGTGTEQE